jgi:hypothetical protein
MSHITGTLQVLSPSMTIGPGMTIFNPPPAPGGTLLLMLHFTSLNFKAGDHLEVKLGYAVDVFTAADGPAFWTRPINVYAFPGGVEITYVAAGPATGSVQLDKYGRGERHREVPDPGPPPHSSLSNCDPFYLPPSYVEPTYDPWWYCTEPPQWDNIAKVTDPSDIRTKVARSVGTILTQDTQKDHITGLPVPGLSTCSVTLVDIDKVITAGHCHTPEEALTSSVIFNYQTDVDGLRPAGYNPRFYKVKAVLAHHNDSVGDFSLLQLAEPVAGVPIAQMRHDLPVGEQVFGIHHPNGAVKKISPRAAVGFLTVVSATPSAVVAPSTLSVSGGSSGSGLFDLAGRVVGVLSGGGSCGNLSYFPTASILTAIAPTPPPPITRDVMLVFDRSGSMSMDDGTGRTKIEAARDALSLFIQLVNAATGNRLGLVSFSTSASAPIDFTLTNVVNTPAPSTKTQLIGPPPFVTGKVGALAAGGNTAIGDGLDKARGQLTPAGPNPRAILLLTDGLQNTGVEPESVDLAGITVHAIGFGTESSLDGPRLNRLATAHGGRYLRAGGGLTLEKFFSDSFGHIFENGIIRDPEFDLPADQPGVNLPFRLCGEEAVTVVAGWDRTDTSLFLEVTSPGGAVITASTPGLESSSGRTWTFLRIKLPIAGERDGLWHVRVVRPSGGGEFPPPTPALRYFLNVIPTGGPVMSRLADSKRYYTGDTINPRVIVRFDNGGWPENMQLQMTITKPDTSVGNVLSGVGLGPTSTLDGDVIPARQATLRGLESSTGNPVVRYVDLSVGLSDNPSSNGSFESGGLFGRPMTDLLNVEGNYTFHAMATYGDECIGMREVIWSIHVDVGIDPGKTTVTTAPLDPRPDGGPCVRMTFMPRDRFGNLLGPGRLDGFTLRPHGGSTPGAVTDLGNGSYQVDVCSDPDSLDPPGVEVVQPERPPVVIAAPEHRLFTYSVKFVCGEQKDDCCRCAPVVPGRYATEINILNPTNKLAAVEKRVIPLMLAGAAAGREPNSKQPVKTGIMKLPAQSATMDDCCRILEMVLGAPPAGPVPLTLGILEIISTVELCVTAVYTASDGRGGAPSIDVKQIAARPLVI